MAGEEGEKRRNKGKKRSKRERIGEKKVSESGKGRMERKRRKR